MIRETMSKGQISRIYPGTTYVNRKKEKWFEKLLERDKCCVGCGSKKNLQPHHIISCSFHDEMYLNPDNGVILCQACHDRYHGNYFPVNKETFEEFINHRKPTNLRNKKFSLRKKKKKKKPKKYNLKKYEHSPLYSKIKINDFTKKTEKTEKKSKPRRRKVKKKFKRLNPIYLTRNLGYDDWDYIQRIELEKEVLGDF